MLSAGILSCIGFCVLSAFHPGSSRWKRNLATRSRHHSHHAAFHFGLPKWKQIWLPSTLVNQTKLPPRRARWRAAIWNRRRDLVARRGFHPRKVDGVPGNTEQYDSTLRSHVQKWHNSKVKYTLVNCRFLTAQDLRHVCTSNIRDTSSSSGGSVSNVTITPSTIDATNPQISGS